MITIIHGDDLTLSRDHFLNLKRKQNNAISYDGGKVTITDLVQNIEGGGFFGDTKIIFIEDLLTKRKKTDKESREILNFISKNSKEFNFVLWESKEILKRDLFVFKDATVKIFKLPKNIFLFLGNLKPNNAKNVLNLFHQTLESGIKEELILFMLQRQIRILLALRHPSTSSGSQIDEVSRLASWQLEKLERQAKLFHIDDLIKIYKRLYEIEIGQKTGGLSLSFSQSIDFLLLEI